MTASAPSCVIRASVYRYTDSTRVSFSGTSSTDVMGPIQSYRWDYDDFSGYSSGATATRTYSESGTYVTTLTVTNSAGMSSSCYYTTNVTVSGVIR